MRDTDPHASHCTNQDPENGGIRIGTDREGFKGKVFCLTPSEPGIQEIKDITPPLPYRILTRGNQICVLYSDGWLKHWGRDILDTVKRNGSSLEWQCYLGSYIQCKMSKQRKPACTRCEFRDECRKTAETARQRARR